MITLAMASLGVVVATSWMAMTQPRKEASFAKTEADIQARDFLSVRRAADVYLGTVLGSTPTLADGFIPDAVLQPFAPQGVAMGAAYRVYFKSSAGSLTTAQPGVYVFKTTSGNGVDLRKQMPFGVITGYAGNAAGGVQKIIPQNGDTPTVILPAAANIPAGVAVSYVGKGLSAACGVAHNRSVPALPGDAELCASGTVYNVTGSGPWSWQCKSFSNTVGDNCTAQRLVRVAACGTAHGQSRLVQPSNLSDLCQSGIPGAVTGGGGWSWRCDGVNSPSSNCSTI